MKNAFGKNKILFAVLGGVLVMGIMAAAIVGCSALAATEDKKVESLAETQTKLNDVEAAKEGDTPVNETPAPAQTNETGAEKVEALQVARIITRRNGRRDYIIPVTSNSIPEYTCKTWEKTYPDANAEESLQAVNKANEYAELLFGASLEGQCTVTAAHDSAGFRGDFLQVADEKQNFIITLNREDLSLINADRAIMPEYVPEKQPNYRSLCESVCESLGYTMNDIQLYGSDYWEVTYLVETDKNALHIGFLFGELELVSQFPDKECAEECAYFTADVTYHSKYVEKLSETSFSPGEPQSGDMNRGKLIAALSRFIQAATGKYPTGEDFKTTFYIDNSGDRENYWHVECAYCVCDIAAKSGDVISMSCSNLYGQGEYDLTGIPYEKMGGEAYVNYVKGIAILYQSTGRGSKEKAVKSVSVNAVYDDIACTMIVVLEDNTSYEYFFENGKLKAIEYTFDDDYYGEVTGWKADNIRRNKISGEIFFCGYLPLL